MHSFIAQNLMHIAAVGFLEILEARTRVRLRRWVRVKGLASRDEIGSIEERGRSSSL
jgi:hypothetical protein